MGRWGISTQSDGEVGLIGYEYALISCVVLIKGSSLLYLAGSRH